MTPISTLSAGRLRPLAASLFSSGLLLCILTPQTALAQCPKVAEANKPAQEKTIPQIYDKLSALGYWNIDKIEYHQKLFEVRANDKHGGRMRLSVDALSGEITEARRQDRRKERSDERDGLSR